MTRILLLSSLMFLGTVTQGGDDPCGSARATLESQDPETFKQALQAVLDHECEDLLPRVAELFTSDKCPARFRAADALALSGDKRYGPLLTKYYFEASAGIRYFDPGSLVDDVILACSDLPRGRNLYRLTQYVSSPPRLDKECLAVYRKLQEGHYDERVTEGAIGLLIATATPDAIDIVERAYKSSDSHLREGAVIALQHLPLDVSLPIFKRAIADRDWDVRYQVVRLLGQKRDTRVRSLFEMRLAGEKNERIAAIMKNYLKETEGGEP